MGLWTGLAPQGVTLLKSSLPFEFGTEQTVSDDGENVVLTLVVWGIFALVIYGGFAAYRDYVKPRLFPDATNTALPPAPPAPKCATDHRFEKMDVYPMNLRADIALDSCTGQVCRTWDWAPKITSGESAWSTYESRPLCSDLLKSNP
jgi:hypothetical protein